MSFDAATLAALAAEREVRIVATRPDDSVVSTIIWAVVDGDDVFVRSWKGERGHWYRAATDRPDKVELVAWCRRRKQPVIVCGSAGGRTDRRRRSAA